MVGSSSRAFTRQKYSDKAIKAVYKARADALSYNLYPLQGMLPPTDPELPPAVGHIGFAPTRTRLQGACRAPAVETAARARALSLVWRIKSNEANDGIQLADSTQAMSFRGAANASKRPVRPGLSITGPAWAFRKPDLAGLQISAGFRVIRCHCYNSGEL
ncbi:hypothetical protein HOY82DRAFT_614815 [Tuber indicum]|nr:hypothetical protein HOY82DRAFT_614815 [Tuber indicum]